MHFGLRLAFRAPRVAMALAVGGAVENHARTTAVRGGLKEATARARLRWIG
jgi:hypothetical protein